MNNISSCSVPQRSILYMDYRGLTRIWSFVMTFRSLNYQICNRFERKNWLYHYLSSSSHFFKNWFLKHYISALPAVGLFMCKNVRFNPKVEPMQLQYPIAASVWPHTFWRIDSCSKASQKEIRLVSSKPEKTQHGICFRKGKKGTLVSLKCLCMALLLAF